MFSIRRVGGSTEYHFVIDTLGNVGIGTTSPEERLEVAEEGNTAIRVTAHTDTPAQRGQLRLARTRGTQASPTIVQNGDRIGSILGQVWDGSGWLFPNAIEFDIESTGTVSSSSMPSKLGFYTTPEGSTTRLERLTIKSDHDRDWETQWH